MTGADSTEAAELDLVDVPSTGPGVRGRIAIGLSTLAVVLALGIGVPLFSLLTRPSGPLRLPGVDTTDARTDNPLPVVHVPLPIPAPKAGSSDGSGPSPTASVSASASARPSAGRSGRPPSSAPPPAPAHLTAHYATLGPGGPLGAGYEGQVTISNPGQVTVSGWTVTISLPNGETVSGASGAAYSQNATTVTFTPAGNASVPGGGSVKFTFTVDTVLGGGPTGCQIDGRPCG